ncbi:MAG: NAD(P)H-hydrate dehydratase [Proteobacteria bacterium]|nr:NAD(P)H-hydrate dehydratase [Pseudomonadota bacterium]
MRIVNANEMKEAEKRAEELGIYRLILMENAGRSVYLETERIIKEKGLQNPELLVVCGKGNNGGDGFVVARYLHNHGYNVKILFLGERERLSPESLQNFQIISSLGLIFIKKIIVKSTEEIVYATEEPMDNKEIGVEDLSEELKTEIIKSDIIIDAIFGTGLSKDITGYYKQIIDFINQNKKYVISVDIPSGIDSDTGKVCGVAIKADLTVALGYYKLGHFLGEGREYCGQLKSGDISLPRVYDYSQGNCYLLEEKEIKGILKKRKLNTHKGSYGHVVVLGGSKGMSGAALLACVSALKSGCGLVTAIIPEEMSYCFQVSNPEIMTFPVKKWVEDEDKILNFVNSKDALIIGCGLGLSEDTKIFLKSFITKIKIPVVIDADGLNIISENPEILKNIEAPIVLTPHIGEMERLSKTEKRIILTEPHKTAVNFANTYGVYLVLKSSVKFIAEPKGSVFFSAYGNPGMATAGSGDVLSGIIGSFIGQGYDIISAIKIAVTLHSLAGDSARSEVGENALTATDIIKNLHKILKKWEEI